MTHPPRDSWIRLSPAQSLQLDPRLSREWYEKTHHFRLVRGTILAAAFQIEYMIDRILSKVFFPTARPALEADSEQLAVLLNSFFLSSGLMSFDRKIKIVKGLASEIPKLAQIMPGELPLKLGRVRDKRNRFAHDPIVFTPTGEPPDQELVAVLVGHRGEIILDKVFLEETQKLLSETEEEIQKLYDLISQTVEP
jgi:hypothetical protein